MLKKTIAALSLAAAAAIVAQPAYAAASLPTTGTHTQVVSLGAFPTPLMAPMDDGSPTGGVGRR
ncbi:hypothetical protein GCM10023196_088150 [Actinoallomurus vinaceus]|uniref:Uncharacterized protein n=1 Tax=Actinoallomurus vinaceus TaxID=1080074 RepID=A0ABP8UQ91_9ACTN